MMKVGKYDEIDRPLTWLTLSRDLPSWGDSLPGMSCAAVSALETDPE